MKLFIKNIALFFMLLCIVLVFSDVLISYKNFNHPIFDAKLKEYTANKDQYDAIIFGSSLVYRQIQPKIFEEITGIRSYNFGVPSNVGVTKLQIFEELLEEGKFEGIKYIILEAGVFYPQSIKEQRINTLDGSFFYSTYDFFQELQFIYSSEENLYQKIDSMFKTASFYFKSRFKYFKILEIFDFRDQYKSFEFEDNGYNPIELVNTAWNYDELAARRNYFVSNQHLLDSILTVNKQVFELYDENAAEFPLLDCYYKLISLCNKKGIKLIYLVFPKTLSSDKSDENYYFPAMKYSFRDENLFDFSDPLLYSQFFSNEYHFDHGHFNRNGTIIFTKLLAEKFLSRVINTETD